MTLAQPKVGTVFNFSVVSVCFRPGPVEHDMGPIGTKIIAHLIFFIVTNSVQTAESRFLYRRRKRHMGVFENGVCVLFSGRIQVLRGHAGAAKKPR